jgi:hypothetical protein
MTAMPGLAAHTIETRPEGQRLLSVTSIVFVSQPIQLAHGGLDVSQIEKPGNLVQGMPKDFLLSCAGLYTHASGESKGGCPIDHISMHLPNRHRP